MYKKPIDWTPKRLHKQYVLTALTTSLYDSDSDIETALMDTQNVRLKHHAESFINNPNCTELPPRLSSV